MIGILFPHTPVQLKPFTLHRSKNSSSANTIRISLARMSNNKKCILLLEKMSICRKKCLISLDGELSLSRCHEEMCKKIKRILLN